MPALIPRFVSFCRTHHLRASESKGHQQPIDLVWLWFRSPSDWLAASTMRSSEPPYRPGPERCPCAACPARRAPVVSETPGEADYSLAKVPLQRGPVRPPPNIDEQGSLPYKPRQLSGMTRGPRRRPVGARSGSFRAGCHPDFLSLFSTGRLSATGNCPVSGERSREADLSTQQIGAQAPPRLPRPPRHHRRPQGPRCAPCAWPQAPERLRPAPPENSSWSG